MNIININSKYEVAPWEIKFIEDILNSSYYIGNSVNKLNVLTKSIPIFNVNEETFTQIKNKECLIKNNKYNDINNFDEYIDQIILNKHNLEKYGYYLRIGNNGSPEIYICTEIILRHTNNNEEFTCLLAKVIIDKLANAYLGIYDYGEKDEFYFWMEESSVTFITLYLLQKFVKTNSLLYERTFKSDNKLISPYDYAVNFAINQSDSSKLGYYLHKLKNNSFGLWRFGKGTAQTKHKEKKECLEYFKSNIDTGDYDTHILSDLLYNVLTDESTWETVQESEFINIFDLFYNFN